MNGSTSSSKDLADITNIIPPKLIRNYDVFIVLKPKENDKIEENLIDFDTDASTSKICELFPKTDQDTKKEFNVIDLYENIDTDDVIFDPLKLKNTNENTDKHDSYDKEEVLNDLKNAYVDIKMGVASNSIIKDEVHKKDYNIKESYDFDQKEDFAFPTLKLLHEADEDLIDEVLSTNIRRLAINNDKYRHHNNHNKTNIHSTNAEENVNKSVSDKQKMSDISFEIPKIIRIVSKSPDMEKNKNLGAVPKKNKLELKTEVSLPVNDTENKLNFNVLPKINNMEFKINPKTTINTENIKQYVLPNQIFAKPEPPEKIRHYIDNLLRTRTKYCNVLKYYNPKDFYKTVGTNEIEFVVETMELDQKKYRQRRIVVEDSLAATYTAGPSLDEKKLVLPQMMDRLLNKKKRMDKFSNCKPKLILDCGSLRKKDIPLEFNPVVLADDRNRERLRNLLTRQNFDMFVREGGDMKE